MWKKYLAFIMIIVLMVQIVPVTVFAQEEAILVQNSSDVETEEQAGSVVEPSNLDKKEELGDGQDDGSETVQYGENNGQKQPEESSDSEQEKPKENDEEEVSGEITETSQEQLGEDIGQEEKDEKIEQEPETGEIEKEEVREEQTEVVSDPVYAVGDTGEYQPEGTSYQLTYTVVDDGIKITGITGTKEGELKIPAEIDGMDVVEIGSRAFDGCDKLTGELVIPNGVRVIGWRAFGNCKSLVGDLRIPDSVTTIGEWAFYSCSGFTGNLVISKNAIAIGEYAFIYCRGLTGDLIIPDSVETIGENAFSSCSNLTGKLVLPKHMTKITKSAFSGSGITSMSLEGITEIGDSAFSGCKLTGDLVIPDSVTAIGASAFSGCSNLTGELILPKHITSISNSAFSGTSITSISLEGIVQIGNHAFDGCKHLTGDLVIPNSVTSIGEYAFEQCTGLTGDLVIPDSVISIGENAFWGCSGLTGKLVLPENMIKITPYAFARCGISEVDFTKITEIGEGAFSNCSGLQGDLVIPDSVTSIGKNAFNGCSGLTGKLVLPEYMTQITPYAFAGSGITEVDFSKITEIGEGAFSDCSGLTDVVMPENVTTIGDKAFLREKSNMYKLTLKSRSVTIGIQGLGCNSFIYGYTGSTAETYATDSTNECLFFALDSAEEHEIEEYRVSTTEELMAALGSYRRIILVDGIYKVIEEYEKNDRGWWEHVPDTGTLILKNLISVSIEAEHPGEAEILSRISEEYEALNTYAGSTVPVVEIIGCKDIKIEGCILGHESELAGCESGANVLNIKGSCDVDICQCDLFGCGYTGISCQGVENVAVDKCVIRDCESNILDGYGAKNLCFTDCIFSGHKWEYEQAALSCSGEVSFTNCKFINNKNPAFDKYGNVKVSEDCVFYNNAWDGATSNARSGICLNGITWQLEYVQGSWTNEDLEYILKLGYPLKFDNGAIGSAEGTVLDYSDAALPWKEYKSWIIETRYYDGSDPTDPVESIMLDKDTLTLSVGEIVMLTAEIIPDTVEISSVTWASSDPSVATVEDGLVTVVSVGECIITASADGKSAVCYVTVTAGQADMIIASGSYENVNWQIDGSGKLTVEGSGEFTNSNAVNRAPWFDYWSFIKSAEINLTDTTNASYLFNGCQSLMDVDVREFDTGNVTDMTGVFQNCSSLTSINLSSFDMQKVTQITDFFKGCQKLSTIYVPCNLKMSVELPRGSSTVSDNSTISGDIWYDIDGNTYTELPRNLSRSIVLTRNQKPVISEPYIILEKGKIRYVIGEKLNTDDLKVIYYNETGISSRVNDYTTNANEIDMSTPGTKTLVVTYRDLHAEIKITVIEKQTEETPETKGLKITFKNEQDRESVYTGSAIKPEINVSYNGRPLVEGTNYTVKYANNVKAGYGRITVTGKGNFRSTKTQNFTIVRADIVNAELAGTDKEGRLVVASGSKFAPIIYYGSQKLTAKDYSISGAVMAGKKITDSDSNKVVTIKGRGNYTGDREIVLRVVRKSDLTKFTVTLDQTKLNALTYDGRGHYIHDIQGALTVIGKDGNTNMKRGMDYMIVYPANVTDAGVKKFSVVGMGLYTGAVSKTYTIKPAVDTYGALKVEYESGSIDNIKLPYRSTGVTFNEKLKITDTQNGDTFTLREGKDYKVTYSGNKKIGSNAKFTISFLGNYKGIQKQTRTFTIEKADLKDAAVVIADAVYKKNPGIYKSIPYVIEQETGRLIKASNYHVTYYVDENRNREMKGQNKVSSGDTVYVKIEAKPNSNYKSDMPLIQTYRVTNAIDLSKAKITFVNAETGTAAKSAEYTGQKITDREIKVLVDGKPADENMIVTYADNIDKGQATVIVTGTGEPGCRYTGCKKAAFSIVAYSLR